MEMLKKLYFESYLYYLITLFSKRVIPVVKDTLENSFINSLWIWFNETVVNTVIFKILFNPEYVSDIWYKSYFYRASTLKIRKLSFHIPRASFCFRSLYVGFFLSAVLLVPDAIWNNLFWVSLFSAVVIFYLSRNLRNRIGMVFALVNFIILLFLAVVGVTLPFKAVMSAQYLLFGIDLFFLISFSVKSLDDLKGILVPLFISAAILCFIGLLQDILIKGVVPSSVFRDGVRLGEILILIFPFAFVYPLEYLDNVRKPVYTAFLFTMFLNVILATQSKAALIGFVVELVIFILCDIKFFPFLILLMPLGLGSIINNIKATWDATTSYGNIINNIINLSAKIWNLGFGIDREKLMSLYSLSNMRGAMGNSFIKIPYINISPIYINFVVDIGSVFMVIFFAYILRVAHSSLTMFVMGEKKYKRFFAAGLATLVAVSVSAFFETTIFSSRTMLIYWAMLGILRAVRIMNLGVYET